MRDHRIADLRPGRRATIAGRVIAAPSLAHAMLLLRDASGSVRLSGSDPALCAGDIAALDGVLLQDAFAIERARILVRPARDPACDAEWRRLADPRHHARLRARAALMRALRHFFDARDFLEVETGQLVDEPGQEPTLEPFRCGNRFLITSPELRMKRLLAAGHERIFELSHVFRDGIGERSPIHHPEFTMLEWYRAFAAEEALIADLEALLPACADALAAAGHGDGRPAPFAVPFERLSVSEAFRRHAGMDLAPFLDADAAAFRAEAKRAGVRAVAEHEDAESLFFRVLIDRIEPALGRARPTILWGYPAAMAALARTDERDPRVARRFELYAGGVELANAFFELNDAVEQRRRFEADRAKKRADRGDPGPLPRRFLDALEAGMPPAAGIALGVDRLLMQLVGATRIDAVLAFPDAGHAADAADAADAPTPCA